MSNMLTSVENCLTHEVLYRFLFLLFIIVVEVATRSYKGQCICSD